MEPLKARRAGSSPLARGTPPLNMSGKRRFGLIPARAGNTPENGDESPAPGAHPRSRGEHIVALFTDGRYKGSSPLARGTQDALALFSFGFGLIPARAGNTEWKHGV